MKCGKLPFAKGSCRAAYRAQEFGAGGKITPVVHKVSLSTKSKDLTRQKYEVDGISCQAAAIYLAKVTMINILMICRRVSYKPIFNLS